MEDFDVYSEYYTVQKKNPSSNHNSPRITRKDKTMSSQKSSNHTREIVEKSELETSRIADRALLLLSFKDTPTQNLHHVLQVLGIHSVEEKKLILLEIFRLIREGIVYVPRGLPLLIEKGIDNVEDIEKIDLVLLQPYDHLIGEIQKEISTINGQQEK
jgi:hypothetical protein